MELWIRSQDNKTLVKSNRIDVEDTNIIVWDNDYRCSETYMGEYKTQARALEILDEIQFLIYFGLGAVEEPDILRKIKVNVKSGWYLNNKSNVVIFEMPKE